MHTVDLNNNNILVSSGNTQMTHFFLVSHIIIARILSQRPVEDNNAYFLNWYKLASLHRWLKGKLRWTSN